MINVLVTLIAGVICQLLSNSYFVQEVIYEYSYLWYKLSIAAVYLSFSLACVKLAKKEVFSNRNKNALLISVLCLCMLVTAAFNVVMINEYMFYALTDYKSGRNLSWKNIYLSIELAVLTLVITDGFKFVFNASLHSFFIAKCFDNINKSNTKG